MWTRRSSNNKQTSLRENNDVRGRRRFFEKKRIPTVKLLNFNSNLTNYQLLLNFVYKIYAIRNYLFATFKCSLTAVNKLPVNMFFFINFATKYTQ